MLLARGIYGEAGNSLLGSFQVLLNGAPVTAFESVKVRALLAYLATEYTRATAAKVWPRCCGQTGRSNRQ